MKGKLIVKDKGALLEQRTVDISLNFVSERKMAFGEFCCFCVNTPPTGLKNEYDMNKAQYGSAKN